MASKRRRKKSLQEEVAELRQVVCELQQQVQQPDQRRIRKSFHRTSQLSLLGLPLYSIAMGPNISTGAPRGSARGVLAVGDVATGVIAIGGRAYGVIAVGGLAAGLVAVGGCAFGLIAAVGGVAAGYYSVGGVSCGIEVKGGLKLRLQEFMAGK